MKITGRAARQLAEYGSPTLIAIGIAVCDQVWDDIVTDGLHEDYLDLSARIADCMCHADEPRFSLYDYLDGLINATSDWFPSETPVDGKERWQWLGALSMMRRDPDACFARLVELAEDKRRVYES